MITINDAQVKLFEDFLKSHDFFYVIAHKEPDGDAVFSCLGISSILTKLGLRHQLLSAGPFKRNE
ncbi:MAG: bifunctional oligoribonuclease/PAP phosphatase NrnA, partial [Treponema sp.]|nr:bifunctional oligoribonuclease/PAP phosphatase NrnA [Treponema sp.]